MKLIKVLIFVIVMSTTSSSLLVGINYFTSARIARNEELKLKSSALDVLEIPYEKDHIIDIFGEQVKTLNREQYIFYASNDGGVAFEFYGPGLWGPISGMISVEKDLKTIRKIKITHQEETPGLGGRIAEESFLKQFKNKEVLPMLVFKPEGKAVQKNEVDAITGATGSSKALEKLINDTISKCLILLKEEGNA